MSNTRIPAILGAMIALLLFAPSPSLARQDNPPTEEQNQKAKEREKKAKELHQDAVALMDGEKFEKAREALQVLRERYRNTFHFVRNARDITDRLFRCGKRITVDRLGKQKLNRKPHIDTWHGIQFHPPENWRGIPPARKPFGHMDDSEVNYSGQNIRITRYTSPYLENLHMMVFKRYDTRSQAQLEDKVLQDMAKYFPGLSEESNEPLKSRLHPATRRTFRDAKGNRLVFYHYFAHRKGFTLVGIWKAVMQSFVFISTTSSTPRYEVKEADWDSALAVFDQAAKSFWILPQAQLSAAKRRTRNGVVMPGWKTIKTRNYTIEYSTRDEYAKRIAKHIERVRAFYRKTIPTGKGIPKCHIKLFDNEEDFQYYAQAPGAAAYWSPGQEEMVAYRFSGDKLKLHDEEMVLSTDRNPEEETFHIMNHEGFHQYMYYLMGRDRGVYVPSWLNEGVGDYFFGGAWEKKKGRLVFEIKPNWWRLETIVKAVKEGTHVPLREIFRYTQNDYYANPGLCYAEGWAICYFFLKSPAAKKRGYDKIPRRMLQALQTGGDWEKATDTVLGRYDLDRMEMEWKEYVLSLEK